MEPIKTAYQAEKQEKEKALYQERKELLATPGAMITAVDDLLCAKYGIHSRSTIWSIVKRVDKQQAQTQENEQDERK